MIFPMTCLSEQKKEAESLQLLSSDVSYLCTGEIKETSELRS